MSKRDGVAYYYIGGETVEYLSGVPKMDITDDMLTNMDPFALRALAHSSLYSESAATPKPKAPAKPKRTTGGRKPPTPKPPTPPVPEVEESANTPEGSE